MQASPSASGMALGLLSDAHGDADAVGRAAARLLAAGAGTLLYLGDACDDRVLDALAGLPVAVHLVAGNCDRHPTALARYAAGLGLRFHEAPALLEVAGKRVAFAHGHETGALEEAQLRHADYFLHGHLHRRLDDKAGSVRVICVGSVSCPRDGLPPTAALLDVKTGDLRWFDLASAAA